MFSVASFSCALFIPDTSQTLPDHFLHLGSIFGSFANRYLYKI